MNNKYRKLQYIRYKNKMKKKGYCLPKWKLESRCPPYKWKNLNPGLLEEKWMVDFKEGK